MTNAVLKHRTYVPYGWIAIEYCQLNFTGKDADKLGREWRNIQYSDYDEFDQIVNALSAEIENVESQKGHWWNIWHNASLDSQLRTLEHQLEIAKGKRFKSASILKIEAHRFLNHNGFHQYNVSTSGGECVDTTEFYKKD